MSEADPPPPTADRLRALDSDDWATVLVALRQVLGELADGDERRAVAALPTGRLVGGPGRERAVGLLATDVEVAAALRPRLDERLAAGLSEPPPADDAPTGDRAAADVEVARARARSREHREDRDTWRRRAAGAEARAAGAEADLARAREALAAAEERIVALELQVTEAARDREQAVERERRRRDGEVARLQSEVATLRRTAEEQRVAERRQAEATTRRPERSHQEEAPVGVPRVTPGRPTRLPRELVPGTTAAARALLGPGRRVLVDGYNVTRQHRSDLDLEGQRDWLVQRCVAAVATVGIDPVVVFDGQRAGGSRAGPAGGRVEVRFTDELVTADDEIVLTVEATDVPIVVVTDDRELSDRVRVSDADVVGTTAFLSAIRS